MLHDVTDNDTTKSTQTIDGTMDDDDDHGDDNDNNDDVDSETKQDDNCQPGGGVTSGDDDKNDLEPWVDWIRRCTHDVEERMQKLKLDDWTVMQKKRKWAWARTIFLMPDNEWVLMAMRWDPTIDIKMNARRRQGRPRTRWCDDLVNYIRQATDNDSTQHGNTTDETTNDDDNTDATMLTMPVENRLWQRLAQDEASWEALKDGFCRF